jgi:hypothetical protein
VRQKMGTEEIDAETGDRMVKRVRLVKLDKG